MINLTELQQKTLDYIIGYVKVNMYQPSIREMADYFKITFPAVRCRLIGLEKKGVIKLTSDPRKIIILNNKTYNCHKCSSEYVIDNYKYCPYCGSLIKFDSEGI